MKKVAIYYRVSTDKQDLASQTHAVERWLAELPEAKKPIDITVYKDEGISGSKDDRPGFQAMLQDARSKKLDTIICYRLDRFSRSASTAIRTILDLDDYGVAFVSVTQPVLNLGHENPFRRTMLAAFAEISEIERTTTISRINAGIKAAKERGVKFGRPNIYGPEKVQEVIRLSRKGMAIKPISEKTGISVGRVHQILKKA